MFCVAVLRICTQLSIVMTVRFCGPSRLHPMTSKSSSFSRNGEV